MNIYISDECKKDIYRYVYDSWGDKDYAATVKRDWEKLDDAKTEKAELQIRVFKAFLLKQGIFTREKIERMGLFINILDRVELGDNPYKILSHFENGANIKAELVGKIKIAEILQKFPESIVDNVCDVFGDHLPLNELWREQTYLANKFMLAVEMKKELEKTVTSLSKQIDICKESSSFPAIVLTPIEDALNLATAYRDFLNEELLKASHRPDGSLYSHITSREEWNGIIVDVVNIIRVAIRKNYKVDERRVFSLTSKLFSVTFPWSWGKLDHNTATKKIRERYDRAINQTERDSLTMA